MRNWLPVGLFAAVLVAAQPAMALRIAMPNYQAGQKAVLADTVVVGKVTSIEADTVELPAFPGAKEKTAFKIAVIKVETALVGAKNVTHIKVAFAPMAAATPDPTTPRPVRPRPGFGPVALTEGQEGIFFLMPQTPGSTTMSVPAGFDPIALDAANYKDELAKVTKATGVLADPTKALKAEKLADRQSAVAVLGQKYRQPFGGGEMVEEAIPAELTKLILATILEVDWKAAEKPAPGFDYQTSGPNLANIWGLSPGQNGIPKITIKPGENYIAKFKQTLDAWAKTDGEKLELKKFVPKEKK